MNFMNSFSDFWEILTGVLDDNKSKIIRYVCFILLIAGIGWAGFNYLRADLLANTEINALPQEHYVPPDDGRALKRMADLAQTVQEMRHGGNAIAEAIANIHTRPFNVTGEKVIDPSQTAALSLDTQPVQTAEEAEPEIFVRAIMLAGKTHAAVVDAAEEHHHNVPFAANAQIIFQIVHGKFLRFSYSIS